MTTSVSSYGWNATLSPLYANWAAMVSGANGLVQSGLPASTLQNFNAAQVSGSILANGSGSPLSNALLSSVALNPNNVNAVYNAAQMISSQLGNTGISTNTYLSQIHQFVNPILPTSPTDGTAVVQQYVNSQLENQFPNTYLNVFNPYNYQGQQNSGSLLDLMM